MFKRILLITSLLTLTISFIFAGVEEELKKINEKLDGITKQLQVLEKKVGSAPPAQNNKKKSDPNAVYNIPIAGSVVLGNPNAKITITEFTDFQ